MSGDSFVNLRCSLLTDNASFIDSDQFVAMATQLENEARAIIAKELRVKTSGGYFDLSDPTFLPLHSGGTSTFHARLPLCSPPPDVTDVIVWGNISGSFYIDLQRTKVFNFNGAIKGPAFFSQSLSKIVHDRFVATT